MTNSSFVQTGSCWLFKLLRIETQALLQMSWCNSWDTQKHLCSNDTVIIHLPLNSVTDNQISNGTVSFLFWFLHITLCFHSWKIVSTGISPSHVLAHQHPSWFALIWALTSARQKKRCDDSSCQNTTLGNHVCAHVCVYIYRKKEMEGRGFHYKDFYILISSTKYKYTTSLI